MSNTYFRHGDVAEIKRHIDYRFAEFQRELEWKAKNEKYRVEAIRNKVVYGVLGGTIIVASVYDNWDLWRSMFGA